MMFRRRGGSIAVFLCFLLGLLVSGSVRAQDVQLDVTLNGNDVDLSWSGGADPYAVRRGTVPDPAAWGDPLVGQTAGLSHTDSGAGAGAQIYYYRITEVPPNDAILVPTGVQDPYRNPSMGNGDGIGASFFSGAFFWQVTDLQLPSRGPDFALIRTYNSQIYYPGPLGRGWDFNYNMRLIEQTSGDVDFQNGFGRVDTFTWNGSGYDAPAGFFDELVKNGDETFTMTRVHGDVLDFDADGRLLFITDRHGRMLTFGYGPDGLSSIIDDVGRETIFTWSGEGRLQTVVDHGGRQVTYTYDVDGFLSSVTWPSTPSFPAGVTCNYDYDTVSVDDRRGNLETIYNGRGQIFLENAYDASDRLSGQSLAGGAWSVLSYAGSVTTVTDFAGNITDWTHDADGHASERREYTNRNVRPTDPSEYVTQFTHDADGLLTGTALPAGDAWIYQYDGANPSRRGQGNLLSASHTDGADPLVTSYTYDPVFNLVKTVTDPREDPVCACPGRYTSLYYYDCDENSLGDLNGDGITGECTGKLVLWEPPAVTVGTPQTAAVTYTYNAYSQLETKTDGEGNLTEWLYGADGYVQQETGDAGGAIDPDTGQPRINAVTTYIWDPNGNLLSLTDPNLNTFDFVFDDLGHLIHRSFPGSLSNYAADYLYDADGNLIQEDIQNVDGDGNVDGANPQITNTYDYDPANRLTATHMEVDAGTVVHSLFEYDENGSLFRDTSPLGNTRERIYDERGLLASRTDGANDGAIAGETLLGYNWNGRLEVVTDPTGREVEYEYDAYVRPSTVRFGAVNTIDYAYDRAGNVVDESVTGKLYEADPGVQLLRQTEWVYDERSRLYQIDRHIFDPATGTPLADGPLTSGDGKVSMRYEWDRNNNLLAETDDNLGISTYSYDGLDRRYNTTDAIGNYSTYSYDPVGNRISETEIHVSPEGYVPDRNYSVTRTFDEQGRMTSTAADNGDTIQYAYDSLDNMVRRTDGEGDIVHYEYDARHHLTGMTFELRDSGGVLTGTIDRDFLWDDDGRMTTSTDGKLQATTYQYDARHRLIQSAPNGGLPATYLYDLASRVIHIEDANQNVFDITHDLVGRPAMVMVSPGPGVAGTTQVILDHDATGILVRGDTDYTTANYSHDSLGRILSETQNGRTTTYEYDGVGNLLSMTYPGGPAPTVSYGYDALNRLETINGWDVYDYIGPRGLLSVVHGGGPRTDFEHDTKGRVNEVTYRDNGSMVIDTFVYTHDAADRILSEERPLAGLVSTYEYDSLGRLITFVQDETVPPSGAGITTNYYYDDAGNMEIKETAGVPTIFTFDGRNRIATVDSGLGPVPYVYDENGNWTIGEGESFIYDAFNRPVEYRGPLGDLDYTFDAFGRLAARLDLGSGTPEEFTYAGPRLIQTEAATPYRSIWGLDLINTESGGPPFAHLQDPMGSDRIVTDFYGPITEETARYTDTTAPSIYDGGGTPLGDESAIGNSHFFDTDSRWDSLSDLYIGGSASNTWGGIDLPQWGSFVHPPSRRTIRPEWPGDPLGNPYIFGGNGRYSPADEGPFSPDEWRFPFPSSTTTGSGRGLFMPSPLDASSPSSPVGWDIPERMAGWAGVDDILGEAPLDSPHGYSIPLPAQEAYVMKTLPPSESVLGETATVHGICPDGPSSLTPDWRVPLVFLESCDGFPFSNRDACRSPVNINTASWPVLTAVIEDLLPPELRPMESPFDCPDSPCAGPPVEVSPEAPGPALCPTNQIRPVALDPGLCFPTTRFSHQGRKVAIDEGNFIYVGLICHCADGPCACASDGSTPDETITPWRLPNRPVPDGVCGGHGECLPPNKCQCGP